MVTLRRPPGRFARVGHRGASALAPENTLEALELAVELGCDMLELDVLPLIDGTLVVAHPALLELARGAARGPVRRRTRAQVESTTPKLPTLDEVLQFCGARLGGIVLQLDLKRRGVEDAAVASLRRHCVLERAWVSAFDPATLRRVAELAPDLPRSYTLPRDRFGIGKRRPLAPVVRGARAVTGSSLPSRLPSMLGRARASAATLHHSITSAEAIRRAHDVGAAVYVWTVDDPALAQRLVDAGADGIITNDPRIFGSLKT